MRSPADSDSQFSMPILPLDGSGEFGALPPDDQQAANVAGPVPQNSGFNAPHNLPTFDLTSTDPLPDLMPLFTDSAEQPPVGGSVLSDSPAANNLEIPSGSSTTSSLSGAFWLDGEAVMCGCPECGAPMTIRIWLMLADCWKCGTTIELSQEQEREIRQLLQRRETQPVAHQPAAPPPAVPDSQPGRQDDTVKKRQHRPRTPEPTPRPTATPPPPPAVARAPQPQTQPQPAARPSRPRRPASPSRPSLAQARIRQRAANAENEIWITNIFRDTPAWLISLILHIIALMLLALLRPPTNDEGPAITLSVLISRDVNQGGRTDPVDPTAELAYDLPVPDDVDTNDPKVQEAIERDRQDAKELLTDPDTQDPNMPDIERVREMIADPTSPKRLLAGRDPRVRVELVKQAGGTVATEAAVARGLRWLAQQQLADGSWQLQGFPNPGRIKSDSAATSLALLPFLGAGQTHLNGQYRDTVAAGVRWLVKHQQKDGYLGAGSQGNTRMYAHGQGAIVLCEAFAMTGDEQLRDPAQRAINYIVTAQHPEGGWRYLPGQRGDTSVLGWQVMAMQSAKAAMLRVPSKTLAGADRFLDTVAYHQDSLYAYTDAIRDRYDAASRRRRQPQLSESMTAEGLLCRVYLGWSKSHPSFRRGLDILAARHPATPKNYNIYYLYYATQAFRHAGGRRWDTWNYNMQNLLTATQERRGSIAGSWTPAANHDRDGGRLFMTSLAICCLEVYYRHLPIFQPEK